MLRSGTELFSQNYSLWLSWVEEKETNSWNTSQSHLFLIGKIPISSIFTYVRKKQQISISQLYPNC